MNFGLNGANVLTLGTTLPATRVNRGSEAEMFLRLMKEIAAIRPKTPGEVVDKLKRRFEMVVEICYGSDMAEQMVAKRDSDLRAAALRNKEAAITIADDRSRNIRGRQRRDEKTEADRAFLQVEQEIAAKHRERLNDARTEIVTRLALAACSFMDAWDESIINFAWNEMSELRTDSDRHLEERKMVDLLNRLLAKIDTDEGWAAEIITCKTGRHKGLLVATRVERQQIKEAIAKMTSCCADRKSAMGPGRSPGYFASVPAWDISRTPESPFDALLGPMTGRLPDELLDMEIPGIGKVRDFVFGNLFGGMPMRRMPQKAPRYPGDRG